MYFSNVENFKAACGYEIDGVWYPRVTSIISIKAKPALYKYYADLPSFAAGEQIKNKSAEEGTLLHETVEAILAGKEVTVPETIQAAVNEFKIFQKQHEINPLMIEERIFSKKHHYAGTIDVFAEVDGRLGVVDIKTSLAIYRDYGMQAAAYVEALTERPSMPNLTRWVLRLDQSRPCIRGCGSTMREKGGTQKVRTANYRPSTCDHVWGDLTGQIEFKELDNLESDTKAFLAAKALWEWENEYWLKQIR